ncbi:MAG: EAL domain-containing protein [Cyanobacteria bacterium J06597_16]
MTYFPHLPRQSAPDVTTDSTHLIAWSKTLLNRISCLLQCPTGTPQLWRHVLSALGQELSCSETQLLLSASFSNSADERYGWRAGQGEDTTQHCANREVSMVLKLLWQHFGVSEPLAANLPWQMPTVDLRFSQDFPLGETLEKTAEQIPIEGETPEKTPSAQLSTLVAKGAFHLTGTQYYLANQWPNLLQSLFVSSQRISSKTHHIALLPLCYAPPGQPSSEIDCAGVLVLLRSAEQPLWTAEEVNLIETVGSQIYLALRRSRLDQVARSRRACDQLTQLPDRVLFNQQLERSLATMLEQDSMLGVAFLDLDRFKNINDTLGHEAGDCLLQQVAERLKSCLRGYDVVGRWGGDEFTLILSCLRSAEDVSNISERILRRLADPFQVQGEELYVTASLGIALAPYDGEDEQTLLRNADAAMYQAKARGRNTYQIYFEEINADARRQLNLETDLRKAIEQNELFLCYQPQVDLFTEQWIGMEALIRWQHPSLGLISPAQFIPIAEETGLIELIGHWVLEAACSQYRAWQQQGLPQMRLAVNLSPHQFHRSHLVRSVMKILTSTGFDPRYLELEVTESAAMHDVEFAIDVLKKLSNTGIQIAMDDFGTGYSSLSVLKHFPLDTLKIDRSFVMDLVDSPSDAAIASTIIALAKGLNFKVLAEGIETPKQAAVLKGMGCDYAQGYLFSHPLSVELIDKLLANGQFCTIAKQPHAKQPHAKQA